MSLLLKNKQLWIFISVIVAVVILVIVYHHAPSVTQTFDEHPAPNTGIIPHASVDGFIQSSDDRPLCSLSAVGSTDKAYWGFIRVAKVIDALCWQHNVSWFLWGDVSLRLHQIGARLLKAGIESRQSIAKASFDIVLASENPDNIGKLRKVFAKHISAFTDDLFTCSVSSSDATQIGCYVMSSSDKKIKVNIYGPAIINSKSNELRLMDERLPVKYSFKLKRIFPLNRAFYYGFTLPVPKEPVYAFSHAVPFKKQESSSIESYKYKQGCNLLYENLPENINGEDVKVCGQKLQEKDVSSIYRFCSGTTPQEEHEPLSKLMESQPGASVYLLEDFKDVIIVERGTGKYNLGQPNGLKQVNGVPSWSQYGQDKYIDELFKQKRNGFFIEVGAHNGETLSNTIFFEKVRGWDGLLIEAIPSLYKQLKAKNRNCFSTNACVSKDDDTLVFTIANFLSSSKKYMLDEHKRRIDTEIPNVKKNRLAYEALVHCKSLTAILDKINVHHIDYFSLDVEGSELILLNAIDWDKTDIELFTIETDHHRDEIIAFMKAKGYNHIDHLSGDDLFRKIRH